MAKRKPRLVPNYQPLGKLIGAARGEINATQADLANAAGWDLEQIKTLEKARRPYPEVAAEALRYVPVDLEAAEMAQDAAIEILLGADPRARVVAKEVMLARLRTYRDKGYLRIPARRARKVRELVPRDGIEPPTRGSSDRCSRNKWSGFIPPRRRVPMPSQHKYCAHTRHLDRISSGWR